MSKQDGVSILGIFVADTAYRASRMPVVGETLIGSGFSVGPGGKGSNQAVAAARAGAKVSFISKLGDDTFGHMALETYRTVGVTPEIDIMEGESTGAAFIFIDEKNGDNAIIVYPGAAQTITVDDVESRRHIIESSRVFVTQLEQPADAALHSLMLARQAGVTTLFNPAPAEAFPDEVYGYSDYIVPNETEAENLVGHSVETLDDARRAAQQLRQRGVKAALITLGEKGAYLLTDELDIHIPPICKGTVIDTSGAGDAFVGGFAAALAAGKDVLAAAHFGSATAGLAVTRRGTAPAMPEKQEVLDLLDRSDVT